MNRIAERILELVYPSRARCLGCGDVQGCDESFLCEECRALLKPAFVSVRHADWRARGLDSAMFAYYYKRPVNGLIRSFKFHSVKLLADIFRSDLAELVRKRMYQAPDVIVPVPLHPSRRIERGFNQAEILGRILSEETGIETRTDLLRRVHKTRQQSKLKGSKRGVGLTDAFSASGCLTGKRVLLLDDVITTGGTACACADALKAAGVAEVHVVAVAGSRRYRQIGSRRYRANTPNKM